MKRIALILIFMSRVIISVDAQDDRTYEPSAEFPFGQPNPNGPKELLDFAPLIGINECESVSKKQDGSWASPVPMTWSFKYIMNGMAIQDETLKADGGHSGSIRQYSTDSARWYVHYYSTSRISSMSTYQGNMRGEDIVLYKNKSDFTTSDGKDLFFRLSFTDISDKGFEWVGEWVSPGPKEDELFGETWKISCTRRP